MMIPFAECQDASDETVEYCASKCCPPFGFRCGYGACVDEKARCDGNVIESNLFSSLVNKNLFSDYLQYNLCIAG